MKTGIIAEFNPFHSGHEYLLNKVRDESEAVIVVMSQDVMQRGEFSAFNKWWRTRVALENGADLVIGLPAIVSGQSAETFASESLRILEALGIDQLAFGVESPDTAELESISRILADEPPEYKTLLKENLKRGLTFPRARMIALENILNRDLRELLNQSNNILGIEYNKAILRNGYDIKIRPIKRIGNLYTDEKITTEYPSATGIRNAIKKDKGLSGFKLPYSNRELLRNYEGVPEESLFEAIMLKLLNPNKDEFKRIAGMNEDILNRLLKAPSQNIFSYNDLLKYLKTKNVTKAFIRRLVLNIILGITKEELEIYKTVEPYLRVLGFNEQGREVLSRSGLKQVSSVKRNEKELNSIQKSFFKKDLQAANIRTLLSHKNDFNLDYINKPVIINSN